MRDIHTKLTLAAVALNTVLAIPLGQSDNATHPCAEVSRLWTEQKDISAAQAFDCLNSIPLYKEKALQFIDEVRPYLEWQSDTAYKKNPPPGYPYEAYDLFAELDRVREGLQNDVYNNEYEWQSDLYQSVVCKGHDGHFDFYTDVLSSSIEFVRPVALISVSEDGVSLPAIKVYEDVVGSTVEKINGMDAVEFIYKLIHQSSANRDLDAAYNTMFFEKAIFAKYDTRGYFESGGRNRFIYPGPTTKLTFANGTTVEYENKVKALWDWSNITDDISFIKKYAPNVIANSNASETASTKQLSSGPMQSSEASGSKTSSSATASPPVGYPKPVVADEESEVSGYFLDEPGLEDVAVLAMLSFNPFDSPGFQSAVQEFFAKCVGAGKTKLVVDLQSNGGGIILQGYDTFRQIFPDIVQQGLSRYRYHEGFEAMAELLSRKCADYAIGNETRSGDFDFNCNTPYNWRFDLNQTNGHFLSYEDKFPPVPFHGDEYTQLLQWDLNNPVITKHGFGSDITGYGSRKNFTRPFGGPENIVVLHDGYCGSTCSIFAQFMKHDAGVKSIAMGGRPQEGLIQGVGGIKGSHVLSFGDIHDYTQVALDLPGSNDPQEAVLNRYTEYAARGRCTKAGINARDAIERENIDDGTPSQYVNENADCRLYWTQDMINDVSKVWSAAAKAAFRGGKCAAGGINYENVGGDDQLRNSVSEAELEVDELEKTPRLALDGISERLREMLRQNMQAID
ncbi:hypothetical protein F4808DRAFT_358880 [Astrocystis sublimbata]|nr:hypothetical protein F4808DRAFT_358880 [Astrocystis sublimbata]